MPPWSDAPAVAAANVARLEALPGDVLGQAWPQLRAAARQACLAAAAAYRSELGFEVPGVDAAGPVIVGGHQPELFHPGVWAKNFAVHALARKSDGVGLHLIVDNDTCQRSAIRVPIGDRHEPRRDWLQFDAPQQAQPWEELRITDPALFASFADRTVEAMRPWHLAPAIADVWPQAVAAMQRGGTLADALTVARMAAERAWSAGNLELPLSRLCTTTPFLTFAAAVMARADDFARHHNAVLAEYRRLNRIRSRSHPVPELVTTPDGWTEAPFWIWRAGETHRDRLFIQPHGDELWLRNRTDVVLRLSLTPEHSLTDAVEQLESLSALGWRLRTRALTTTLFARLCLADLFVHGLGGAKYDEMTDALMARFFGVQPPAFLTVTATVHLPLGGGDAVSVDDVGRLKHALWDLTHNPQRWLNDSADAETRSLIAERRELVAQVLVTTDRAHRHERRAAYRRVHEITDQLAARLADRKRALAVELDRLERRRSAHRILANREYSWTLFPAELLRGYFGPLFD
jgi:hypothetical protein